VKVCSSDGIESSNQNARGKVIYTYAQLDII
jgi:hypothetical protein